MRKRKQKAVRFLCLLMLGAVLSCMVGCAGKDGSETEQPALESVTYSNLTDAEARTLLSGLLEKSAVWGRGLLGTIRTGINYTVLAVRLVEKYSQETGLPVTDESLWERAAKELQIP